MKKIAVILSGCGNKDGAEIHESVSLIIALHQQGAEIRYFAPNATFTPLNFLTNEPLAEKRNIMLESARITRSEMIEVGKLSAKDFDGLALPGGFGIAKNLSNWASQGVNCEVHPEIERVIKEFHSRGKPIAAICIAPAIVAKVLGRNGITLTIGNDKETAAEINKTGAHHEICPVDDFVTDREHKIITTPAYMYGDSKPNEVFRGISGLVKEFIEMA